jgi:SAM-dependent methyltransferase
MAEQNAYQVADWNGQSGARWVANQARFDAMLAVFGQAAIEAAAPATGERVLDVGCGAGASSLALAARVGAGGQVLGVDISEPLIGRAHALAPQDTPARFRVADASSVELPEGASAGAARPRTIGCACRWARSRTSSHRSRRPILKRPAHSRSPTGGAWHAS